MNTMSSKLVLATCILFLLAAPHALGRVAKDTDRDHYVNSTDPRADDSGPGSRQRPWKSLAAVNSHTFKPGDSVHFARSSSYKGGFVIKDSGTAAKPIMLTTYGKGPPPSFSNSDFNVLNGNVIQIKGSYVIVDGLYFHDGAQSPTVKNEDVLRVADIFVAKGADHNIIQNSEVKNSPVGFHICGQFNLITRNRLHDTNRYLAGANWGPIAIVLSNGNNEVSYNRITNYLSIGGKYGADGGALEFDPRIYGDPIHDVKIHHNYSYGNEGFLESTRSDSQPTGRVWIAYNVSNDYQEFILLWQGHDWSIENNTVLRVLPKNSVTDVVFTFRENGNAIWNNIFVVSSGRKVFPITAQAHTAWQTGPDKHTTPISISAWMEANRTPSAWRSDAGKRLPIRNLWILPSPTSISHPAVRRWIRASEQTLSLISTAIRCPQAKLPTLARMNSVDETGEEPE